MNGKWGRLGAFVVAAFLIVAAVVLATNNPTRSWSQILLQATIIAVGVYATTFVVWPRSLFRRSSAPIATVTEVDNLDVEVPAEVVEIEAEPTVEQAQRPATPERDERPVAVIGSRPAGSEPGSRVHIPENPTARNPRGRPVGGHEPSRDFRWPAQR